MTRGDRRRKRPAASEADDRRLTSRFNATRHGIFSKIENADHASRWIASTADLLCDGFGDHWDFKAIHGCAVAAAAALYQQMLIQSARLRLLAVGGSEERNQRADVSRWGVAYFTSLMAELEQETDQFAQAVRADLESLRDDCLTDPEGESALDVASIIGELEVLNRYETRATSMRERANRDFDRLIYA